MSLSETKWERVNEIAAELGVKEPARQKWRQRGKVPPKWHLPILREAKARKIDLRPEDFMGGRAA